MKYGIEIDQVYVPADGSNDEVRVLDFNEHTDEVKVQHSNGYVTHIDAFKLTMVRYNLKD